jgi:Domain of unknown function (DUF4136)
MVSMWPYDHFRIREKNLRIDWLLRPLRRTLVVDIYEAGSERLMWRGLAHDQLSDKPEKNTEKLQKAVDKMLDKFPPRSV